ncbi:MAG TPA: alpha/beta hydrolase [Nocardiopsis listeri]|uniref:alpha/beta fold hydrolase n=1 Tax=Nocardiopsis listeri TaxID=53440 RepID=UPI001E0C700F|nr:alpha/beta fold hydrolase [Nocardiopsis listeri]HJE59771.1 alpha/beta hydrolase [Nocardiopsis listeri]
MVRGGRVRVRTGTRWVAYCGGGVLLASLTALSPAQATTPIAPQAPVPETTLNWEPCEDLDPVEDENLECATLTVPMVHEPGVAHAVAETVEIALSRVPATGTAEHTMLVNPGGPGSAGRQWASHTHLRMPEELRETYDVVAFDPRGMGASTPGITCDPDFFTPVRKDTVPADAEEEQALRADAEAYADACAKDAGPLLDHMRTEDTAHDMDAMRVALGRDQVDYLGYSYGSYLGTVYSSLYPDSVRAVVLDSVVDPDSPWYESNLAQSRALDRAAHNFFDWVARHDDTYGLGADGDAVADAYYDLRSRLGEEPAEDTVGPTELEGAVIVVAYSGGTWPAVASALSAQIRDGDSAPLVELHENYGDDAGSDPGYGGYLAVQCTDAEWPKDWKTWNADARRVHEDAPFMGWHNIWYNAPCATWGGESAPWFQVGDGPYEHPAYDGDVLLVHATDDGATSVEGAHSLRERLPGSSLVIEDGGITHGVALTGNACVDEAVVDYLREGVLPERGAEGPDLTCDARPEPEPRSTQSAPHTPVDRLGPIGLEYPGESAVTVE